MEYYTKEKVGEEEGMTDWDRLITQGILKRPGEHGLVIGTTGSGKTQLLYYLMDSFIQRAPKETLVWFDSGKSGEALVLSKLKEVTIHSRNFQEVIVLPRDKELLSRFTFKRHIAPADFWSNIDHDRINVFCLEPFYRSPKEYSIVTRDMFMSLIDLARDYKLKRGGVIPLTIFIDELQWLVPTDRTALNREHNEGAKWFQRNIEMLRSHKIRIIAATQNWMKIRAGARESFSWLFLKRGAQFFHDRRHLQKYNNKWLRLDNNQFVLVMPDSIYSEDFITTPFFGNGDDLGEIEYHEKREEPVPREPVPGFA